jgi:hypothetical protein
VNVDVETVLCENENVMKVRESKFSHIYSLFNSLSHLNTEFTLAMNWLDIIVISIAAQSLNNKLLCVSLLFQ